MFAFIARSRYRSRIAFLVALLCCTALTPIAVAAPEIRPCRAFGTAGAGCANGLAIAHASDDEDEIEEAGEENEDEGEASTPNEVEPKEGEEGEEAEASASGSPPGHRQGRTHSGGHGHVAVVSELALTAKARSALRSGALTASSVGFSCNLSASAKLEVTLVRQAAGHGRTGWRKLPDSLVLKARQGHTVASLVGHNRLNPGRYRLTITPAGGHASSIYLTARP